MIVLCIDEGNTSVKMGLFAGDNLVKYGRFEEDWASDIPQFVGVQEPERIMFLSSKEDYASVEEKINHPNLHIIRQVDDIPLTIEYLTPKTLGKDRVISAYAATQLFPDDHCAIFNIGTCLTSDFVERGGIYKGGNISPGLKMRLKSMHKFTAKLPWVEVDAELEPLGLTTEQALQNGAYYGMLYEIQGFIISLRKKYNYIRVMLTGGDANYFAKRLEKSIFVDPFLNLKGLHYLSQSYA